MAETDLPLSELRIVEIGTGEALAYCGKVFSDFGAEVIKIEPPGGDPGRKVDILTDIGGGKHENAHFAWLNTNKASITADLSKDSDIATVRALLATADLLLDSRPVEERDASALSHDNLKQTDPGLAITAIDWFHEHGPYRQWQGTESVMRSLAGLIKYNGPIEGPPVMPREGPTMMLTALTAFIPSLAGLLGRKHGARRYAANAHEALLQVTEYDLAVAMDNGRSRDRTGVNRFGRNYPSGTYQTKEGWMGLGVVTHDQWVALCKILERPDMADDLRFVNGPARADNSAALDVVLIPALLQRTAQEWFDRCLAMRLPAAIVPTMKELLAQKVHRERNAFADVTIGEAKFEAPAIPYMLTRSKKKLNGPAPLAGEHNGKAFAARNRFGHENDSADANVKGRAPFDGPLPLEGIRVVDLTMGWAGPTSVRQLADLGADVIKVESLEYTDWFRGTDLRHPYYEEQTYERDLKFLLMNRNKRGITLDLTVPEGTDILKDLIKTADIVVDSYAADVMPRLGLDAESILKVNPKVIVATMPAFGMNGTWSGARAYGSTLEQASGLPSVTGRDSDPPVMNHSVFGDPFGGVNAASAMLIALMDRRKTGVGQHINLSQVQGLLPIVARYIVEQSTTGAVRTRPGNRHHEYVPHGCYKAANGDNWLTIAVRSDAEWQSLCDVMQRPDLAADESLKTTEGRRKQHDMIDEAISKWLIKLRVEPVMFDLQSKGIPAGTARLPHDLLLDPQLFAIGHWEVMERPFIGPHLMSVMAYREDGRMRARPARSSGPLLGEHNDEVLGGILKLSPERLADLAKKDIVGRRAIPKKPRARNAKAAE